MLTKVGEGASAEIYAYGIDRVIKLFRNQVAQATVELEWRNSQLAHRLGIPGPRAFGMVRAGERLGIAFERCEGPTLLAAVIGDPDASADMADLFFSLQQRMHRCDAAGLPPAKDSTERKIRNAQGIDAAAKEFALAQLRALPDGRALCHGDFHARNVVLTAQGPKVLDWLDAGAGEPSLDVARSLLLIDHASAETVDANTRERFRNRYLQNWQREWPDADERIGRWRYALSVARLSAPVAQAERAKLRQYIGKALAGGA